MRATTSYFSIVLATIFAGAAPAHAQIYRWLDGNGAMMYSTDRPADPGALKEYTVIDPVTRPPTSPVPADAIAQEPPRLQIERDTGSAGVSSVRDSETERGTIVIREAPPQSFPAAPTAGPPPSPVARDPAVPLPSLAREPVAPPFPGIAREPDIGSPKPSVWEAEAPPSRVIQDAPAAVTVRELPPSPAATVARELEAGPAPIISLERESTTNTLREPAPAVLPPVTREVETRPRDSEVSRQAKPEPTTPSALARELEGTRAAPAPESQPSRTITIIRDPEPPARPAVAGDKPSTPTAASQETDTSAPAKAASDAAPRRRARLNPNLPEAVQDPCLRSSDPKCYEKNKSAYVPFRGYSPSAAEARESGSFPPVGATHATAAGGSASGGSTPKAPKSSDYALPPGSDKPRKLSK